jgi:hypothetical protein
VYRPGKDISRRDQHTHFLMPHAALGDLITSLPAVTYARHVVPLTVGFTVWAPEHQLELVDLLIGRPGIQFKPLHKFDTKTTTRAEAGPAVMNAGLQNTITRNKMDMVTFGFVTQLDTTPPQLGDMNYPHMAELGQPVIDSGPYVVISSGATSDNKIFHPRVMAQVVIGLKSCGYNVVILGKSTTHVKAAAGTIALQVRDTFERMPQNIQDQCIDLRDKTTLIEARDIIGHAEAIIGVDGGMLHLAGTTGTPIVYGITSVDPAHRGIVRHGKMNWKVRHVTPKDLACAGCQSHWLLVFGRDFRECGYNDNKCVEELKATDMLDALEELLNDEREDNA